MKKYLLLSLLLLFLCACQKKETRTDTSKENSNLTWVSKQEKSFGKFDYLDRTQQEAEELLVSKFSVRLPEVYKKVIPILEDSLQTELNEKEEPVYLIKATGDMLFVKASFAYKNKETGKYYSYGDIELTYEYDPIKKVSWLAAQEITLVNYPMDNRVYLNEPIQTIEKFAEIAEIDDIQSKIKTIEEEVAQEPEKRKNQEISMENTMKEAELKKTVGKNIGMDFADNGTLQRIYLYSRDYSK